MGFRMSKSPSIVHLAVGDAPHGCPRFREWVPSIVLEASLLCLGSKGVEIQKGKITVLTGIMEFTPSLG